MTLTPAYGRDYKSKKEAVAGFEANQDFVIAEFMHPDSGRYVNREQLPKGSRVMIRYRGLTQIAVIKV